MVLVSMMEMENPMKLSGLTVARSLSYSLFIIITTAMFQ
jgi:hypothetical protein